MLAIGAGVLKVTAEGTHATTSCEYLNRTDIDGHTIQ